MVVGGIWDVHVVPGNEILHCGGWDCDLLPPAAPWPQKGHDGVAQLLLSAGAARDAANKFGYTPLHFACMVFPLPMN